MSEIEIKQMQEKIDAGILLAQKRLIEKTKKEDGELVVVEVKTRSDDYLLAPEEAVDNGKIRRIVTAADAYVRFFNLELPVRFDIITVIKKGGDYEIDHIEDAFYAPCR